MASQWGGEFDGHEIDEPTFLLIGFIRCTYCGMHIQGGISYTPCIPNGWKVENNIFFTGSPYQMEDDEQERINRIREQVAKEYANGRVPGVREDSPF